MKVAYLQVLTRPQVVANLPILGHPEASQLPPLRLTTPPHRPKLSGGWTGRGVGVSAQATPTTAFRNWSELSRRASSDPS